VRFLLVCLLVAALPRPAAAFVMTCINETGVAPRSGSVVPPHPFLIHYGRTSNVPFTVTIDGAKVAVKTTPIKSSDPLVLIEVKSDRTGALSLRQGDSELATYTVKRGVTVPTEVPGVIGRYRQRLDQDLVDPSFDGLGVWLPEGTPAILAHVKLRPNATAPWWELVIPVPSTEEQPRPVIRIGSLGCSSNYPIALLAKGVDLEISIELANGAQLGVTHVAPHLTLPTPLPPQPRPRPIRAP